MKAFGLQKEKCTFSLEQSEVTELDKEGFEINFNMSNEHGSIDCQWQINYTPSVDHFSDICEFNAKWR